MNNEIRNLQIETAVVGITEENRDPNFFVKSYVTTITFSSQQYPEFDRDTLKETIEMLLDIQKKINKTQSPTEFTQIK